MVGKRGLLVDFGGVMTTSMGRAFAEFCVQHGVDAERFKVVIKEAYGSGGSDGMVGRLERGEVELEEFERWMAEKLSEGLEFPLDAPGIRDRMFAGMGSDQEMIAAVRRAHAVGIRTGLVSNSWGPSGFNAEEFGDLFDAVVISGEVGMRKPDPEIFRHAARSISLEPKDCVFVDDLAPNVDGAKAVGIEGIVHRSAEFTIPRLEQLLGVSLTDTQGSGG